MTKTFLEGDGALATYYEHRSCSCNSNSVILFPVSLAQLVQAVGVLFLGSILSLGRWPGQHRDAKMLD